METTIILGIFNKNEFRIKFTGITNDNIDLTVDAFKDSLIPLLHKLFSNEFKIDLKILERGFRNNGNGVVTLEVHPIKRTLSAP